MSVQIKGVGTIGGIDQGLDTVGVVTATSFVGTGVSVVGVVTATSFSGSGANLTSLPSQVTINNASGNRVITSDGGTTLNCEDTLRYDGTNFLIGTNTEAPYSNRNLTVAAGGSGSTTVAIEIRSPSNGTGRVIFSDGTSADSSANEGQVIYQQSDHKMLFGVAANYQNMALESTGGTGADLNLIDGNLKFASGHGIDFSATSDGGTGTPSELFDDYEEGSWTPVLKDAASGGNTYSGGGNWTTWSNYTRIGNTVRLHGNIYSLTNSGMNTGNGIFIHGAPFTAVGSQICFCRLQYFNNINNTQFGTHIQIDNNSTVLKLQKMADNSGASSVLPINWGHIQTNAYFGFIFTLVYKV